MAAVVESIISFITGKIGELLVQQVDDTWGVREKLKSLEKDLTWIRSFLRDADQSPGQSELLKTLVGDVLAVAFKMEDAVDEFRLLESRWTEERKQRRGLFKKCASGGRDFVFLKRIGKTMEEIKKEIMDISARKGICGVQDFAGGEGPSYGSRKLQKLQDYRRGAALAVGDEVVGFAKHVEALVERLIGTGGAGDRRRCRRVVSIVATGGAGKTTLANRIYNNDQVKKHFHTSGVAAWVCISQTYNAKYLLQEIAGKVMGMSKQDSDFLSEKDLQERLSEFLWNKRYLIVLDDIWDTDAWFQLKAAFPDAKNGSRIILTTRKVEVARHADPDPANLPFHLPGLNTEDSWKLFLKKAFPWEETSTEIPCSSSSKAELTDVGKQIVKKCGGLPLAISVVGGLLAAKGDAKVQDWKNVFVSLAARLSGESVHCQDIIALSYYDLPYHLKPCFLYLGLFPEDYKLCTNKLKKLWIAEGFIRPEEGRETEDLADDYLAELIDRNIIQVATTCEWDGSILTCRIHDLLHAFAILEGTKYNFLTVYSEKSSTPTTSRTTKARWLAIHQVKDVLRENNILSIRSLLCFGLNVVSLSDLSKGLKLLRVLHFEPNLLPQDLSHYRSIIEHLPFKELTHLRYLDLCADVGMKVHISSSIGNLYNLETLILPRGAHLPREIWKLHRLKDLDAPFCTFEGEPRVCDLKNLHTLDLSVGNWIEEEEVINSLHGLRNLRMQCRFNMIRPHWMERLGSLVSKLVNLRSIEVYPTNGINEMIYNHPVILTLEHHSYLYVLQLIGVRLERLSQLPPTLTVVKLSRSQLNDDPMPTLETLTNLVSLSLGVDTYTGKKMITLANGFPQLKYLNIQDLDQLEELAVEQGAMPKLEVLEINDCKNLTSLSLSFNAYTEKKMISSANGFPQLKCLYISYLDQLEELVVEQGTMPKLEVYKIIHCTKLKKLPEGLQCISTLKEIYFSRPSMELKNWVNKVKEEDWYKKQGITCSISEI